MISEEESILETNDGEVDNTSPLDVNWHLTLAYDGTAYSGWQIQPTHRTVQGEILKRLRLMLHAPELKLQGCSRTDSGVHALDQHANFIHPAIGEMSPEWLKNKLNRWLPEDIIIRHVQTESLSFNARHNNFGKAYTYCISPGVKPHPMHARYVWKTPKPLDADAMRAAAAYLEGEHDFASFTANPGIDVGSTVRKLYRLEVLEKDGLVYINAVGESFLYKMVRGLTGYLVHVGAGHARPEEAKEVLEAKDRRRAADSAPPQGLFLAKVFWQPDEWQSYTPTLPPFIPTSLGI